MLAVACSAAAADGRRDAGAASDAGNALDSSGALDAGAESLADAAPSGDAGVDAGGGDSVASCATPLGNGGCLLPPGPLHTAGNQIVDEDGKPVRIASTQLYDILDPSVEIPALKEAGFNSVRVMWYNRSRARDLEFIDRVVEASALHGIRVILDNHANEGLNAPCWAQQANGLWYDLGGASDGTDGCGIAGTTTDADFMADWEEVARRYQGDQTVIGYDLRNEPLGYDGMSSWGDGDPEHDIRLMYTRVGNAIHAIDPDKLIIVQGTSHFGEGRQWGLPFAADYPVVLNVPNKVVYSVHDYPVHIGGWVPDSGLERVRQLNRDWGFLLTEEIGPVWVGEMGANFDGSWGGEDVAGSEAWAQTLLDYMNGMYAEHGGPSFSGAEKGVSGCWFAWGYLNFGDINGTRYADGSLNRAQKAYWSQMLY